MCWRRNRAYIRFILGSLIVFCQSSKFGSGGVSFRSKIDKGKYVNTLAFGAYKREVFEKIGGYG